MELQLMILICCYVDGNEGKSHNLNKLEGQFFFFSSVSFIYLVQNILIKLIMLLRQKNEKIPKIREHPLQRSQSVTAIIHGQPNTKSNHYIDALERFRRDHATIDKVQRQKKRQDKMKDDERRRNYALFREKQIKQNEDDNVNRIVTKQKQSQFLHDLGVKQTAHTHSIPVNPINLEYEHNQRGKRQANYDQQSRINKLVRYHHLQTCGNSGYNILNGKSNSFVESMIPRSSQDVFQQKLSKYYSQFKLDPNQN